MTGFQPDGAGSNPATRSKWVQSTHPAAKKGEYSNNPQDIDWVAQERIDIPLIQETLRYHSDLYYNAQPEWSDEQYDELFRYLQRLEARNPSLVTKDSPTQAVGAKIKPD